MSHSKEETVNLVERGRRSNACAAFPPSHRRIWVTAGLAVAFAVSVGIASGYAVPAAAQEATSTASAAQQAPAPKPKSLLNLDELDKKIAAMGSVGKVSNDIAGNNMSQENQAILMQRTLVKLAGYEQLVQWSTQSADHAAFMEWFLNDYETLSLFMTGGAPGTRSNQGRKEGYTRAFTQLMAIMRANEADFKDATPEADRTVFRKMAVSAALGMDETVHFWTGNAGSPADPVERYGIIKIFRQNHEHYKFHKDVFDSLPVEQMRFIFENRISNDELPWLANYTLNYRDEKGQPLEEGRRLGAYTYTYTDSKEGVHFKWDNETFYNRHDIEEHANTLTRPANPQYESEPVEGGWRKMYQFTYADPNFPNATPTDPYHLSYEDMTPEQVKQAAQKGTLPVRLWMVFQRGGVCGAIAKTFENLNGMAGVPSTVHGQPGHATAVTYTLKENPVTHKMEPYWQIQNNSAGTPGYGWLELQIPEAAHKPCGWEEVHQQKDDPATGGHMWRRWGGGPYVMLAQAALNDMDAYTKVLLLRSLADSRSDDKDKLVALDKAIEVQGVNQDAMLDKVAVLERTKAPVDSWLAFAKQVYEGYRYQSLPLHSMMKLIIQKGGDELRGPVEAMRIAGLNRDAAATDADTAMATEVSVTAKCLLGRKDGSVATFSFSGEDAGRIVLGPQLSNLKRPWSYSLDGGKNWKHVNAGESSIKLSAEQIAKINQNDDILVKMAGVPEYAWSRVDITVASGPQRAYANDRDNRFYTKEIAEKPEAVANYEVKSGDTWVPLASVQPFAGKQTVEVRTAANGSMLASTETVTVSFTEDAEEGSRMIGHEELRVDSYSSANGGDWNANRVIDGWVAPGARDGEFWHNNYGREANPWIVIDLGRERDITHFDFYRRPGGGNGTPDGTVKVFAAGDDGAPVDSGSASQRVSPDSFKEVKAFEVGKAGMQWENDRVRFKFDNAVTARYIKIQRPSQTQDQKHHFSCSELEFFEVAR